MDISHYDDPPTLGSMVNLYSEVLSGCPECGHPLIDRQLLQQNAKDVAKTDAEIALAFLSGPTPLGAAGAAIAVPDLWKLVKRGIIDPNALHYRKSHGSYWCENCDHEF